MRYVKEWAAGMSDPIVVDYLAEADTYVMGEGLAVGRSDGNDLGFAKSAEGLKGVTVDAMLGISNEDLTTTTDIDDSSTLKSTNFIKTTINPYGLYEAEYSQAEADDITLNGDLTYACSSSKGQPHLGGSWLYVVSGTGAGNLYIIEDSSVSTTTCTLVLANGSPATLDNTSNVIIVYGVGQRVITLGDVDIVQGIDADYDDLVTTGTYGMGVYVTQNMIKSDSIGYRELMRGDAFGQANDDGRSGLNNDSVKFFSRIMFGGLSHAFNVAYTRA